MKAIENPFSKMMRDMKPKKMPRIQQELTACLQCGYCIDVCEAHEQSPWESVTPRGKIYYLRAIQGGGQSDKVLGREVSLSPYFIDAMYRCTGCGNCEAVCHANIPLVEFWETVRKWLVDEGVGPMSAHKGMARKIEEVHNPYGERPSKRGDWWPKEVEKTAVPEVLFFAGCTGSYREQKVPQMGVQVLARAGVTINTLGPEEYCCTSPLLRTGINKYSLDCAQHTVERADGIGAKDMVMTCSGCYKTVSTDFGKFYAKAGQNVYHISQYIEKLIAEKRLPLNNEYKAKVTFHDPCHLGRHMGVFDPPRNVLKKVKGIELVEMDRKKENSRCCGAGGGYKSQYGEMAINIAAERIRDAEETGAEILVTCCPFCVVNLSQGAKQIGSKIKVMDLMEILLKVTAPPEAKPEPPKPSAAEIAEKERLAAEKAKAAALEKERLEKEKQMAEEKARIAAALAAKASEDEPIIVYGDDEDEGMGDDIWTDNSPKALIRRAAWNKGLRCRLDYGARAIPVAFVKPKVAVYVFAEDGEVDPKDREKLEEEGWAILTFFEKDVTDAEKEALEIKAAVKENLKAMKKKKK
ncbi:CoB--CoM heterodisulfide reductase iron-sulfur subunit D [Candidatus Methanoplasma termitum]|uniref:HdrD2 protein n=1 Tax=Candidatus Methanoplasma termitum TaxID=1577791 RepID=A0A0A7LE51_9ARCH|nr:heterodisulfide reductase-related iron-sulfur binding cluster [Candidatus Methanoplasma termitum]AIZ57268.1 CoB--CoM heterodisulfide reductase iron-sulfur subunit D [Candidatus Methanoplasma termitum]MCL2334047.1 heterodisulfide reductase-related iron-sulfur binding cluster [Candidatus Methanoplasma sp.]